MSNVMCAGSVYAFLTTDFGLTWNQTAKVAPADGNSYDDFGGSVSLYRSTFAVGSHFDDDNGPNSGLRCIL